MRKIPPCKDCPDRKLLCHSSCEGYKEWKLEIDRQNKIREEEMRKRDLSYSDRAMKGMIQKMKERK